MTALEALLKEWPNGTNSKAARVRIKELEGGGLDLKTTLYIGLLMFVIVSVLFIIAFLPDLVGTQPLSKRVIGATATILSIGCVKGLG